MKNEITYTEINGINYPNLALPEQPKSNIGKYGQMRLDFLKKYRRGTYTTSIPMIKKCSLKRWSITTAHLLYRKRST